MAKAGVCAASQVDNDSAIFNTRYSSKVAHTWAVRRVDFSPFCIKSSKIRWISPGANTRPLVPGGKACSAEQCGGPAAGKIDKVLGQRIVPIGGDVVRHARPVGEHGARQQPHFLSREHERPFAAGDELDGEVGEAGPVDGVIGGRVLEAAAHHGQRLPGGRGQVEIEPPRLAHLRREELRGGLGLGAGSGMTGGAEVNKWHPMVKFSYGWPAFQWDRMMHERWSRSRFRPSRLPVPPERNRQRLPLRNENYPLFRGQTMTQLKTFSDCNKDDLIVITGAGGFIAGALARYFHDRGFTRIRAVDKKPLPDWYQIVPGVESLCLDVSEEANCQRVCEGAREVYNLAADMGGMGFIERFRIQCLRSILINTHMIEAAYRAGAERYFYLVVGLRLQHRTAKGPQLPRLEGIRRLSGHVRTRLRLGEADLGDVLPGILGRTRHEDRHRPLPQRLRPARHLGRRPREGPGGHLPQGHRGQGPRHAAASTSGATARRPAASCISTTAPQGIDRIMHCDKLIATPINLGSSELISINTLVTLAEEIGGVKLRRSYDPERAARRGGPQQRQHDDPGHPGLGAGHALPRRAGEDLRLDRPAIRGSQGRPADRARHDLRQRPALMSSCRHRPTSSARSPTAWPWPADGSTSRSSRGWTRLRPARWWWWAWSRRAASWSGPAWPPARARWPWSCGTAACPIATRPSWCASSIARKIAARSEPSGSQDMIGLIYPGVNRLDYDYRLPKAGFSRGTSSPTTIRAIARWLEEVIHLLPVAPRPEGYNPLGIKNLDPGVDSPPGRHGQGVFRRHRRLRRRGAGGVHERLHGVLGSDPAAHRAASDVDRRSERAFWRTYQSRYCGAMYSGCGGGYLFVVSERAGARRVRRSCAEGGHSMSAGKQVFVSGGFDDIRSRDLRFLEEAARLGEVNVVLWPDETLERTTGKPPKFPLAERLYFLNAVRYVTRVIPPAAVVPIPTRLPEADRARPRQSGSTSEAEANDRRRAYCRQHGIEYRVLPASRMGGFPEPPPMPSPPGARRSSPPAATTGSTRATCGSPKRSAPTAISTSLSATTPTSACSRARGIRCFPQDERRYVVGSIRYVKQALIASGDGWLDADPEIRRLKPDIYAVNEDGDKGGKREYCQRLGIEYLVLQAHAAPGLPPSQQHRLARLLTMALQLYLSVSPSESRKARNDIDVNLSISL